MDQGDLAKKNQKKKKGPTENTIRSTKNQNTLTEW